MKLFAVYMHINKTNKKKYIGITQQTLKRRFRDGYGYKSQHFWRAIKKYGWDNFYHIVIADGLEENDAKQLEINLIKKFNTTDPRFGYNVTFGGDGLNGYIPTEEYKRNMSARMSGEKNPFYGRKHKESSIEKMKVSHAGYKPTEDAKAKISEAVKGEKNGFYGKKHSIKQKEIWSQNRSGNKNPRAIPVDRLSLSGEYIDSFTTAK